MSSSPRITALVSLALLFCLLLNVSCPFAQSVRVEENPRLVEKSILMKISGRRSLRLHKGLLHHYEAADDFSGSGSEGGAAGARKIMSLLRDYGEVKKSHGMREEGAGASHGKQTSIWEGTDEGRAGFMENTAKVGVGVRHRLRLRSKRKGKGGGGDSGYAGGFVAFNADYHFPRQHPPRNN